MTLSQVRKLVFAPTQDGETFHAAAIRELREETGIQVNTVVGPVADRRFSMLLPSGETVFAVEQYFVVHAESQILSSSEWTLQETQVMADHHWWSAPKLRSTGETVWPEALVRCSWMQVSSNRMRNRHRESICVFTHSGPEADARRYPRKFG